MRYQSSFLGNENVGYMKVQSLIYSYRKYDKWHYGRKTKYMAMVIKVAFVISVIILMVLEFFGKYGSFVNGMIIK